MRAATLPRTFARPMEITRQPRLGALAVDGTAPSSSLAPGRATACAWATNSHPAAKTKRSYFATAAMPVASKKSRPWLPFVVVLLGWYGIQGFFKLIGWLIPSTQSRGFSIWLILAGPTLLAIGALMLGLLLLVHAAGRRAAASTGSHDAFATQLGKALGDCLTRYHRKHNASTQHPTLAVNLADFERALTGKLPQAAYQQPAWWTDESAHAQQWLAQGWQVLDTQLTAPHPHVVFGRAPARSS